MFISDELIFSQLQKAPGTHNATYRNKSLELGFDSKIEEKGVENRLLPPQTIDDAWQRIEEAKAFL